MPYFVADLCKTSVEKEVSFWNVTNFKPANCVYLVLVKIVDRQYVPQATGINKICEAAFY